MLFAIDLSKLMLEYGAMFTATITFIVTGFKMIANLKKNCDESNLDNIKKDLDETLTQAKQIKEQYLEVRQENIELKKQLNDLLTELTKVRQG